MPATIETILAIVGPLISQLAGYITKAITASTTGDQATLDALHTEALAMADALKPAGA